ncbi:hypothetical protein RB195_012448 [Necator americanus]|uniref:Uncharacterized protein n=1 Tax=Necator americanus TaxID=51031 RepID=A0ABR1D8X9_NECAM
MRCLVLFAVCVWIACADIGCNWSSSLTRSAKVKEAPKNIVAAVEEFLKKKLPEDGILTWIKAFGEDGKMYTYAVTGGVWKLPKLDRVAFDGHKELKQARTFEVDEVLPNLRNC